MTEEKENKIDLLKIFQELTKAVPIYTDLYFTLFVQFRNIYTGANTITKSGLTSPNNGLLREWPAFGPNGYNIGEGNSEGTTTTAGVLANGHEITSTPGAVLDNAYAGNNRTKAT